MPVLTVDLDEGLHVLALAFDPGSPTVQLTGALGAIEVSLVAYNNRHAAVLTLTIDCDVNFAAEWIQVKSLGDLDELELLLLGELAREAEGSEVVEQGLLLNLGGGKGGPLSGLGGEC
ncbi:MAG: hypothetical protein A4E65_00186 [Syntrophorhabdus sp. PtaU1.Bin153]|nr:MAG: hypothetical protein A4E65_00186 [Syntrophorhabdus sp. PtaU1.Bin153]